ncbi:MAG TPA: sulfite exporter TauE/SafE family protein [Gaiellaceae bacterium]|nr:sulfite exporter TauE/SafE family protein [Gaiellaceae bacterium]
MPLLILVGLVAGFLSALLGVGGGIVIVPLLLVAGRWELRSATATSLAAIGITATAGVLVYIAHGELKPVYGVLLGIPAAVGAYFGTGLQQRLPVRTLSFLFAGLLFAIAIRMLVQ